MNAQHLHLLVNHLPAAFAIVALLVMLIGFVGKSAPIKKLSLGLMVLVALSGAAAYFTGHAADIFEGDPRESFVVRHEESAETTWIVGLVAGVLGLAGLLLSRRLQEVPTLMMVVSLLVLLFTVFMFVKTANLGGQILHPETRSDPLTKFLNPN